MVDIAEESQYVPIFPLNEDEDVDFDILDCVPSGNDVNMTDDEELDCRNVIELAGTDSKITFIVNSSLPILVVHLNACSRFTTISLTVQDSNEKERFLEFSSKRSIVTLDQGDNVKIPMEIGEGWQRISVDIDNVLRSCFGTRLHGILEISIAGGCRFSKLFLQEKEFADIQLPKFLRVANTNPKKQ